MQDPFTEFKAKQRDGWKSFAPLEVGTMMPAAHLVAFAGVRAGQRVLDVGCGTGVVAITARRAGAQVTGLDLTPELLARAKEHSSVPGYEDIAWREGDAESLPYRDGEFDVVLSQFGHIFAPRPEVVTKEMLRVLKPGGTIAFATWPPETIIGSIFGLVGAQLPPPPGAAPPALWGNVDVVRERLGKAVTHLAFDRGTLRFPALSPGHFLAAMERTAGPVAKVTQALQGEPAKLAQFRKDIEALAARYFDPGMNVVREDYLLTRAVKA